MEKRAVIQIRESKTERIDHDDKNKILKAFSTHLRNKNFFRRYRCAIIVARQEETDLFLKSFIVSRTKKVVGGQVVELHAKELKFSDMERVFQQQLFSNQSVQFSLWSFRINFSDRKREHWILVNSCEPVSTFITDIKSVITVYRIRRSEFTVHAFL